MPTFQLILTEFLAFFTSSLFVTKEEVKNARNSEEDKSFGDYSLSQNVLERNKTEQENNEDSNEDLGGEPCGTICGIIKINDCTLCGSTGLSYHQQYIGTNIER